MNCRVNDPMFAVNWQSYWLCVHAERVKLLASCSAWTSGVSGSMFWCKPAELLALCSCGAGEVIGFVLYMNCGMISLLFTDHLLRIHACWVTTCTEVCPRTWTNPRCRLLLVRACVRRAHPLSRNGWTRHVSIHCVVDWCLLSNTIYILLAYKALDLWPGIDIYVGIGIPIESEFSDHKENVTFPVRDPMLWVRTCDVLIRWDIPWMMVYPHHFSEWSDEIPMISDGSHVESHWGS